MRLVLSIMPCVMVGAATILVTASPVAFAGAVEDALAGYRAGIHGDYEASVALLTGAIKSGRLPPRALLSAYINRGASCTTLARFDDAIADFDRVLTIEPDHVIATANKALALAKWGRYDEAIEIFNRALTLDPNNAKTLLQRGNAYFDQGMYSKAITDYDRTLQLSPGLHQAEVNRVEAARRIAHPDEPCACNATPVVEAKDKSARTIEETASHAKE